MMLDSQEWLHTELIKVEAWEKDQGDLWFWEKIGRLPFKIMDKWTPKFIQSKMGSLIDELGQYVQTGGSYLSSTSKIRSYYPTMGIENIEEVNRLPIATMDNAVTGIAKNRKNLATVQGAGTGIGGIFTLSIDIPFLLGLQLKTLQDIAICYGYDPNDKKERLFIIKSLQFISSDIVGKQAILSQLSKFDKQDEETKREVLSEIQGWREVVLSYRDQFGWKKLFQMIPIAGLVFGAFINRSAIHDIAEAGMMLYRKRRIIERLNEESSDLMLDTFKISSKRDLT
ncbi:EcsC family protein [Psychrobacillus psychrodurans]|uniref:EcsC family protein n=1 Tax=Psychrobacillus TaxID=1221880 RepID=UPI001F4DBDDF|nr:EcsC family protein [Psychrobacillus psychrodurans]MCK1996884.1 EcsC family protein [Psychrobacillus psychrodurans]MCZ8538789.1 EcsC family protein [Psychrobacillus psychrodurans]